jgi:hypothetical protein
MQATDRHDHSTNTTAAAGGKALMVQNPFAALLCFYYDRHQTKLTPDGLSKVAKKYAHKPGSLLPDLESKYGVVADTVAIMDVRRICIQCTIPEIFMKLIPELVVESAQYCREFDPRSAEFDGERLFAARGSHYLRAFL